MKINYLVENSPAIPRTKKIPASETNRPRLDEVSIIRKAARPKNDRQEITKQKYLQKKQ